MEGEAIFREACTPRALGPLERWLQCRRAELDQFRSQQLRDYVGFADRSTDDFVSERLEDPGVKPHPYDHFDLNAESLDLVALAESVRLQNSEEFAAGQTTAR